MGLRDKVRDSQLEIVNALEEWELAAARLYERYEECLPEMAPFWQAIAKEEHRHASMVHVLRKELDKGHIFYEIGRFGVEDIQDRVDAVETLREAADPDSLTPQQALAYALAVESSLWASRFYEVVRSDDPSFKHIAEVFTKEIKDHIGRLQAEICTYGREHSSPLTLKDADHAPLMSGKHKVVPILWNEGLSVGVEQLDKQHQKLVAILNRMITSDDAEKDVHFDTGILDEMLAFAKEHFEYEEALMAKYSYDGLDDQIKAHRAFVKKAMEFAVDAVAGDPEFATTVTAFLRHWLLNHILITDMKYKPLLSEKAEA